MVSQKTPVNISDKLINAKMAAQAFQSSLQAGEQTMSNQYEFINLLTVHLAEMSAILSRAIWRNNYNKLTLDNIMGEKYMLERSRLDKQRVAFNLKQGEENDK